MKYGYIPDLLLSRAEILYLRELSPGLAVFGAKAFPISGKAEVMCEDEECIKVYVLLKVYFQSVPF